MASYYKHNYGVFGQEVLRSGFMRAAMVAKAEAVAAVAAATAPKRTGRYASSFEVSSGIGSYGGPSTRVYGRVTNTAPYAAAVEYGFGKVPKHRTLFKALHTIGGDIHDGGGNP